MSPIQLLIHNSSNWPHQEVVTFFGKTLQEWSLGRILIVSSETSSAGHSEIKSPSALLFSMLLTTHLMLLKSLYCFSNPKSQSLHSSKQKYGQVYCRSTPVPGTHLYLWKISIVKKTYHNHVNSNKKYLIETFLQLKWFSHYHHSVKPEFRCTWCWRRRVLYLDP